MVRTLGTLVQLTLTHVCVNYQLFSVSDIAIIALVLCWLNFVATF